MKDWIIEALQNLGGKGWPREVSKYIWEHYESELKMLVICSIRGKMYDGQLNH